MIRDVDIEERETLVQFDAYENIGYWERPCYPDVSLLWLPFAIGLQPRTTTSIPTATIPLVEFSLLELDQHLIAV